ncbi:hypothetical protein pEaSNUABM10_00230 [Erwinia phage pEa_SNUABM_10]|nr:hypothetical protein pEaSNUABM10_00230 [Erwinia phage pEa_SNUABM_10]
MNVYFDYDDSHIRQMWVDAFDSIRIELQEYLREQMRGGCSHTESVVLAQTLLQPTYQVFYKLHNGVFRTIVEKEDLDAEEYSFEIDDEPYRKLICECIEKSVADTKTAWNVRTLPVLFDRDTVCHKIGDILTEHLDEFIIELIGYMEVFVNEQIEQRRNK